MKRKIILIIGIGIITTNILLVKNLNSTKNELKKKGYSKDEIEYLLKLEEDEINNILNLEYSPNLIKILNNKYYIPYNLEEYLKYSKTNQNIDEVISIVNVGSDKEWYTDTKETNIEDGIKMLVNKFHHLSEDYAPKDIIEISNWYAYEGHYIKKEVYDKYKTMWNAANEVGLTLIVNSSYRTMEQQKIEYDIFGDEYASRPGYSEHQTGLALDIVSLGIVNGSEFENTEEFKWLEKNSYKYGFILRYPKEKENITGYRYESWHYRYVGVDMATKVYESGLTYDEYHAYYCEYKKIC